MCDLLRHKPEPIYTYDERGEPVEQRVCRFCRVLIQRRGILRRWRHVDSLRNPIP